MKQVKTADGSITYYSEAYQETYHSTSGAEEEARMKYIGAVDAAQVAAAGRVRILDVCFGLGYNTAAAIDAILKANPGCHIVVEALENDPAILAEIKTVRPSFECFGLIVDAAEKGRASKGNVKIILHLGDARETISGTAGDFDLVFHDPFSPKKCPELWTAEFFMQEHEKMRPGGVLLTYSCARLARENMKAAGFTVEDGPVIGRRAPGTICRKLS